MSEFKETQKEMLATYNAGRGKTIDPKLLLDKVLLISDYEINYLLNKAGRHCPLEDKEVSKLMKISMILNTTIKTRMDHEISMREMEEGTSVPKITERQLQLLTGYVRTFNPLPVEEKKDDSTSASNP